MGMGEEIVADLRPRVDNGMGQERRPFARLRLLLRQPRRPRHARLRRSGLWVNDGRRMNSRRVDWPPDRRSRPPGQRHSRDSRFSASRSASLGKIGRNEDGGRLRRSREAAIFLVRDKGQLAGPGILDTGDSGDLKIGRRSPRQLGAEAPRAKIYPVSWD